MTRPKYTRKDGNHHIVRDFIDALGGQYRGLQLTLFDTADRGGRCLDWLLWVGPLAVMIEVKLPRGGSKLTEGERATLSGHPESGLCMVVKTVEDMQRLIEFYEPIARAVLDAPGVVIPF